MCRSALMMLMVAVTGLYLCEMVQCQEACGENKVWNDCGTACPSTCQEPGIRDCTRQCVPGCECVKGYHTQADGSCIEASKCP